MSWIVYQHIAYHQPFTKLYNNLDDLFDLSLNVSSLHKFKKLLSDYYQGTYEKIINKIIHGDIIHADETKITIKGKNGYVWVFTNMEEVYFLYTPTREGKFLKDLLKKFKGVLISDFYAAYDNEDWLQQKCLIHLIRDLNDDLLTSPFDDEYKNIVADYSDLLKKIIHTIDKYGLKKYHFNKHKKNTIRFFRKIFNNNYTSELAQKYQKRFIKNQNTLFTFLDFDGVPWNNNNAEHAIKHLAIYRRHLSSQSSEIGLRNYLVLLSIYQTCRYKGINFLRFLISREKNIDSYRQRTLRKNRFEE